MKKLLLLSTIFFSLNALAQIPTNGLVGNYPFNGNGNDIISSNNGTVIGAVLTTDRFGNANSAYQFDGINDTIKLPLQQNNITSYSISSWFKTSVGGPILGGRGLPDRVGLTLHIHNSKTGGAGAGKALFVADGGVISIGKISDSTFNDNKWHHIVGVYAGATGKIIESQFAIYVDGVLISTQKSSTGSANAPINNLTNILIGAHQVWSSGGLFNGSIDDLKIYNRAVNSTEVKALYNEGICYQSATVTDTLVINMKLSGFNPLVYDNTIKVYPNPTTGKLNIDISNYNNISQYTLKLVDNLGAVMFQNVINSSSFNIDLTTYSAGIYHFIVADKNGVTIESKNIVIQ